MGRAVLADADGVMGQDEDLRNVHDGRKARHRLYIVTEDEEGSHIGPESAVKQHAVGNGGHSQLADTEVDVSSGGLVRGEEGLALHVGLVGRSQVRGAAEQVRDLVLQDLDHGSGGCSGRFRLLSLDPEVSIVRESGFSLVGVPEIPLLSEFRELLLPCSEEFIPCFLSCCLALGDLVVVRVDLVRDIERLLRRPLKEILHRGDVVRAEGLAVCGSLALLRRAAVADLGLDDDEVGSGGICRCVFDRLADCREVVSVLYSQGLEAERLDALLDILGESDVGAAFDRDLVGIIEDGQLVQLPGSCQGQGLGRNAFHHAAVAADRVGAVIDDFIARAVEHCCQVLFSSRHTDCHADACAQRSGGGFDADRVAVLRMARGQGAELTELGQFLLRKAVAEQVQQGIKKHGAVAAGKNETVAVRPLRILRIDLHVICPQLVRHSCCAQRQARMSGICLLDRVRGQNADRIDTHCIDVFAHGSIPLPR